MLPSIGVTRLSFKKEFRKGKELVCKMDGGIRHEGMN